MCGGTGPNCPLFKKQYCIDAQYLSCASSSSQCIRMNAEFWVRQISLIYMIFLASYCLTYCILT